MTVFEGDGSCPQCLAGRERLCPNLRSVPGVLHSWGGFAEFMTVQARQAVAVPDALSATAAAALVDAGPTAMDAAEVIQAAEVETAVIVGGGPIGFLLAGILRECGLSVRVVEPQERRRASLERAGFTTEVDLAQVTPGAEAVVDCAGADEVVSLGLELLGPRGLFVAVGYRKLAELDFAPLARKELTVRGIRSGARNHLVAILELAAGARLPLPPITSWPIDQINDAFAALRSGEVDGKAVIEITNDCKESIWTS